MSQGSAHNQEAIEASRNAHKPDRVKVLFVGESPPASGRYFYMDETALHTTTRAAFSLFYGKPSLGLSEFLSLFKEAGCYLEDLCQQPVNLMSDDQRQSSRMAGIAGLAKKIGALRPVAIICVMKEIAPLVLEAKSKANISFFSLPFPRRGSQNEANYVRKLAEVLADLRNRGVLP
jgi:hypothetical protein